MTNSDYLEKMHELIEVYEHLGGEPGTSKTLVDAPLVDPDAATPLERQTECMSKGT